MLTPRPGESVADLCCGRSGTWDGRSDGDPSPLETLLTRLLPTGVASKDSTHKTGTVAMVIAERGAGTKARSAGQVRDR